MVYLSNKIKNEHMHKVTKALGLHQFDQIKYQYSIVKYNLSKSIYQSSILLKRNIQNEPSRDNKITEASDIQHFGLGGFTDQFVSVSRESDT